MELFESAVLGGIPVRNHFVRSATYEGKATEEGAPTPDIERLYCALAEGGVGTIITSYTYITDYEQPRANQLGIYKDSLVAAYRPLVEAVHERGAKIVMQIVHGSSWGQAFPETARILGPSAVPFIDSGIVPKEMTRDEIHEVTRLFARAAARAKAAGFDGVQLHVAHSYLLAQFTSPLYNHRTDEYGGSVENRYRFAREVCQAVRAEVGEDFPLWAKVNSSDEREGGLTVEEFLEGASGLAAAGLDCIEVSGERWRMHGADERAYYADAATRLAELVDASVILTGGLRTKADLEAVCAAGTVRFFGFARPLMKDPAFLETLR
jgi:2,4-dienoyl-CoA reductase-like NADH-dependent reductase (Old Yellow Enzyme family)